MFAEFFMSFEIETNTKCPLLKHESDKTDKPCVAFQLRIEYAKKVNFDEVIDKFAEIKAGKERLYMNVFVFL